MQLKTLAVNYGYVNYITNCFVLVPGHHPFAFSKKQHFDRSSVSNLCQYAVQSRSKSCCQIGPMKEGSLNIAHESCRFVGLTNCHDQKQFSCQILDLPNRFFSRAAVCQIGRLFCLYWETSKFSCFHLGALLHRSAQKRKIHFLTGDQRRAQSGTNTINFFAKADK